MIRGFVLTVITFILLISYKLHLKLSGLKKSLEFLKETNILLRISNRFSFENNLKIINFFYKNNIFKCLECALLIKNLRLNDKNYEVVIGVIKKMGKNTFHAWVLNQEKVIFGESNDLDKYIVILKR